MFLHIGLNTVLDVKDIVAIINLDSIKNAAMQHEEDFIKISEQPDQNHKSLIFFDDGIKKAKYLSPISSLTLKKRLKLYPRV